jgi:hypothetical protein
MPDDRPEPTAESRRHLRILKIAMAAMILLPAALLVIRHLS